MTRQEGREEWARADPGLLRRRIRAHEKTTASREEVVR